MLTDLLSPDGPPVFGLSPGSPADTATVAGLVDRPVDVVNLFKSWLTTFPTDQLTRVDGSSVLPEITWEPWDPDKGAIQPPYSLTLVAAGAFDGYIETWARRAAAWPGSLLLRFAHEMNGSWYPWGVGVNGNDPNAYVTAYRHVHDLFRRVGASNVVWVWSPNVLLPRSGALDALYPGDDYVDLIGVDGYNGGTDVPERGGWLSPEAIFQRTLDELARLAPAKRVLINETAASEAGGSKPAWITQLLSFVKGTPQLAGFVWFNVPKVTDWTIQSSPASVAALKAALDRY